MTYIANTEITSRKSTANGYASLDAGAKVPAAELGSGTDVTTKYLRGDQSWQAVAATPADAVTTQAFGDSPVIGTDTAYAREDHKHGMMTDPTGGKTMPTGDIVGTSDTQTLTGKTLTTPTLTTPTVNGIKVAVVTKVSTESPYTALATDYLIRCNCTDGAITVNLPAASTSTGLLLIIKKTDSSINAVTIDANGAETIDGATTQSIALQYNSFTIICDGTGWNIV